MFIIKISQQHR